MIYGIGIDIAKISRFESFQKFSHKQLLDIYSSSELDESNSNEHYASRFAAKEAFYKALSQVLVTLGLTNQAVSFKFVRKHVSVTKGFWDIPSLYVDWEGLEAQIGKIPKLSINLSISHEKDHAVAMVILSPQA